MILILLDASQKKVQPNNIVLDLLFEVILILVLELGVLETNENLLRYIQFQLFQILEQILQVILLGLFSLGSDGVLDVNLEECDNFKRKTVTLSLFNQS